MDQEGRRPHFRTGIHARGRLWTKFVSNLEMIFLFICFFFFLHPWSLVTCLNTNRIQTTKKMWFLHITKKGVLIREKKRKSHPSSSFPPKVQTKDFLFQITHLVVSYIQLIKYLCTKKTIPIKIDAGVGTKILLRGSGRGVRDDDV